MVFYVATLRLEVVGMSKKMWSILRTKKCLKISRRMDSRGNLTIHYSIALPIETVETILRIAQNFQYILEWGMKNSSNISKPLICISNQQMVQKRDFTQQHSYSAHPQLLVPNSSSSRTTPQ
jgi:hypothetical protein